MEMDRKAVLGFGASVMLQTRRNLDPYGKVQIDYH